jgi:hypothetical protein
MTDSSTGPVTVQPSADTQDDAACRQAAARIRAQRPKWVIIWLPDIARYRARPLFRAPRGTCLTAQTPEEMIAQMDEVEHTADSRHARSRQLDS